MKRKIRIGFDLDGVIINGPPFVPKELLEWLVRSHRTKKLTYRYPTSSFERLVRWLSHYPCFRPPIKKNLKFLKELGGRKQYQLFIISSRYSFLRGRTQKWLAKHQVNDRVEGSFINLKNQQPHLFKAQKIRELKIDIFIDDDAPLTKFLSQAVPKVKFHCFDPEGKIEFLAGAHLIKSLKEIL